MQGTILEVSMQSSSGIISGEDGARYNFAFNQWRAQGIPNKGQRVDFMPQDQNATEIYSTQSSGGVTEIFEGDKNKTVAALLGILLGSLGAHKFYLGYKTSGAIMLGLTISGWILSSVLIGMLWAWIPAVVGLIEGFIYLSKSDSDFEQIYVVGDKPWF